MSQVSSFTVADGSGIAVRTALNAILGAIASNSSGGSAPPSPLLYQFWVNTTADPPTLNIWDGTQWDVIAILSAAGIWALIEPQADERYLQLTGGTLTGGLAGTSATFSSVTVDGVSVQDAAILTSGLLEDSVVPSSAVTQYESDLQIAGSQVTSTVESATSAGNANTCGGYSPATAGTATTLALRDSSGNLTGNEIIAGSKNYASQGGDISAGRGSGGSAAIYLGSTGAYLYFNGTAYSLPNYPVQAAGFQVTSDVRLKDEIEVIGGALDLLGQLRGVRFRWKKDRRRSAGFIAQDVLDVLPEAVMPMDSANVDRQDEPYLTVNEGALIGLLVESVKEERAARLACESRLTALESRLAAMEH